ncbi:unnamed protein product [Boreogadus saida]
MSPLPSLLSMMRAVVNRRGHNTMTALPASLFAGTLRSLKYSMVQVQQHRAKYAAGAFLYLQRREAPPQAPYSLDPKRESPAQFKLGK